MFHFGRELGDSTIKKPVINDEGIETQSMERTLEVEVQLVL